MSDEKKLPQCQYAEENQVRCTADALWRVQLGIYAGSWRTCGAHSKELLARGIDAKFPHGVQADLLDRNTPMELPPEGSWVDTVSMARADVLQRAVRLVEEFIPLVSPLVGVRHQLVSALKLLAAPIVLEERT